MAVFYNNIHTHRKPQSEQERAVISVDVHEFISFTKNEYYSVGIHPAFIKGKEDFEHLSQLVHHPKVVAIGEAGLDKLVPAPMQLQQELFTAQAALAEELRKPLIIHCVKAWGELTAIRKQLRPEQPWIIHGFRGKAALAHQLIQAGFYLSFGYYFQAEAAIKAWQTNRLFIETDDRPVPVATCYARISQAIGISDEALRQAVDTRINECLRLG